MDDDRAIVERRNVERVEAWARKLSFPGGSAERAFAELYTDAPECVVVLAGVEVSAAGGSDKESWARAEIEVAAQFARRSMQFDGIYPSGDTVAVEARRIAETLDGRHLEWPFRGVSHVRRGRSDHSRPHVSDTAGRGRVLGCRPIR